MELKEQLFAIITEFLGVKKDLISLESDFYSDFNASKLEVADLVLISQQKLNINFPEEKIEKIKTVGDLLKLFEENSDEI
ncbi:MAG TPA: hypothetical protein VMW29_03955 [Candidatus Bathyarchaeia archaeon]|nr:hypothetical protein [Candidatus Bathyarchaeia archaeon]